MISSSEVHLFKSTLNPGDRTVKEKENNTTSPIPPSPPLLRISDYRPFQGHSTAIGNGDEAEIRSDLDDIGKSVVSIGEPC